MKLKNLVVINDFDYVQGGASKVAIQNANMIAKMNKDIKVYFFSAVHSEKSTLNNEVIRVNTSQYEAMKEKNKVKGFINGIYNYKAKEELKKLLSSLDREESIIHIHGWTKALSSSVFDIAFKMKFKVVLTLHDYFTACPNGGYFNYKENKICHLKPLSWKCVKCNCDSRNYLLKIYRILRQLVQNKIVKLNERLTDVISISDFSEKLLKETLNKNVRIHRINNPVDLDENPKKVDYKNNQYFLYVGRVSKEKGVDIFCEAITESKEKGIVVGDGSELAKLKKLYKSIEFVGWKNSREVKEYMQGARALIIPSRWYECSPLTPLEAMQYGIPIITSDCNATVDYINENNGAIFSIEKDDLKDILMNFSMNYHPKIENKDNYENDIMNLYIEMI